MAGFLTCILLFPSLSILKSGFQLQQVLNNTAELTVAETALDSHEIPFYNPEFPGPNSTVKVHRLAR